MRIYSNLHLALEQMRVRASMNSHPGRSQPPSDPPRVMVIGPEHSGKTSLCKLLVNYAVRAGQGWRPMLVNVDPSEVSYRPLSLPNCLMYEREDGPRLALFPHRRSRVLSRPLPLPIHWDLRPQAHRCHWRRTPFFRLFTGTDTAIRRGTLF